jgi:hypothetical protein
MARINYKQLYDEKCKEFEDLREDYLSLLSTIRDNERLQNLVSVQNALIWYNRYKDYRQTIITKKLSEEILLFEDWLETIIK